MSRPTYRRLYPVVLVPVVMTGCGMLRVPEPRYTAGYTAAGDCVRHLAAAHAALAATESSAGAPALHAHGAAMHDYHACLASSREPGR
jgi:hypothetical protein